jgi:hypothetical protein
MRLAFRRTLAFGVLACLGIAPAAASAVPLPGSSTPLAGSSFQGGDGNQDDEGPYLDWQGMQAIGRVVHGADPNATDSAFTNGSKEDEPGGWDLVTSPDGVTPANSNILDAWSVLDQPGSSTFLYLGFTRAAVNGTAIVAFELNQDRRLWDNGRALIPCRRTGDLLLVVQIGSKEADVFPEQWVTSTTDSATGCAATGTLDQASSLPDGSAQGASNSAATTSRLPGFFPPSSTIPDARQFGEAALDLGRLAATSFHEGCFAFNSLWVHSLASTSPSSTLKDYVAPRRVAVRTCAASGTKFLDTDTDGVRDPGEPGIPLVLVWADYDNDGALDSGEPARVTDAGGEYVLENIRPPSGTYTVREALVRRPAAGANWICSFPHDGTPGGFGGGSGGRFGCGWGPISSATVPNALGLEFGNWLPAQLTVEKRLWPSTDAGRFDIAVNGETVLPAAGDGAIKTVTEPPGVSAVSEAAVPPADPASYRSSVLCDTSSHPVPAVRDGTGAQLTLTAGDRARCTFVNVVHGAPAIAITKDGPAVAVAGATLRYNLYVTNPGEVAFAASSVHVTDPRCDHAPALAKKASATGSDTSPGTLDTDDTWTYTCSKKTTPPAPCAESDVPNKATVVAGAPPNRVTDDDAIVTTLTCSGKPPLEPEPPSTAAPGTPGAEQPEPPPSDSIGYAGLVLRKGCLGRLSQVRVVGSLIDDVRVSVDGRAVAREHAAILDRSVRLRGKGLSPGRHRVTVRVTFQRGAGGTPVTLTRSVRSCAAAQPRFTG